MISTINNAIAKKREDGEKGFTLIELLVVILIIGVLAAIAIPAFLNQRESAWVSQVESDLRNATIAAESYAVDNNGSYASLNDAALAAEGFKPTTDVTVKIVSADASGISLTGGHTSITTRHWTYTTSAGKIQEVAGAQP